MLPISGQIPLVKLDQVPPQLRDQKVDIVEDGVCPREERQELGGGVPGPVPVGMGPHVGAEVEGYVEEVDGYWEAVEEFEASVSEDDGFGWGGGWSLLGG